MDPFSILSDHKEEVDAELKRWLSTIHNPKVQEAASHILNAGGKRIRMLLLVLAYESVGGRDLSKVLPIAAAIEIIHAWTLIHDDILDKSETRRGVPTVHVKWDQDTAILAGDALNNLAYLSLSKIDEDEKLRLEIINVIAATSLELIDGEMMDVEFEKRHDVSEAEYFEMVKKKTGALISSAVRIGAMLGTTDKEKIAALQTYGELVGTAFQLQDDILDLTGEKGQLGKDIGRDILEGKRTLMVIHAFNNAPQEEVVQLTDILSGQDCSEAEIKNAISILQRNGSIKYAQQVVSILITSAKESLDVIPGTIHKDALLELADFIINRRK